MARKVAGQYLLRFEAPVRAARVDMELGPAKPTRQGIRIDDAHGSYVFAERAGGILLPTP